MEITFTQPRNFSVDLTGNAKLMRKLADHLDITVKEMKDLAEHDELYGEHGDGLASWLADNTELWEATEHGDIEIDQITVA